MSDSTNNNKPPADRRSGEDRRKVDRRNEDRNEPKGVLTTRTGERRKSPRRSEDRKKDKE